MPRNNVDALIRTLSQVRPGPVDATKLRQAMASLTDVVPEAAGIQQALPRAGTVFVGQLGSASSAARLVSGLKTPGRLPSIERSRLERALDGIYIDANGNVHHTGEGPRTTTTDPGPTTTPAVDPAVAARTQEGRNFALGLLARPWNDGNIPTVPPMHLETIWLAHDVTGQLRDVLSDVDKLAGFKAGLAGGDTAVTRQNGERWLRVCLILSYDAVRVRAHEAFTFGPFTGLAVTLLNNTPFVGTRTDTLQLTHVLYSGLSGPQPTDGEKQKAAGDAVGALLQAKWHHDTFCTKAEMTHEQAQLFGKGLQVFGPMLRKIGTEMQQSQASASSSSSSSSSDSESAAKVVGIILVVLGNVLDEVGKAILNTDHGNGITLLTNLWLGFVLTGVPVVWPESR